MVKLLDEHERTLAFAEVALGQIRSLRQTAVPAIMKSGTSTRPDTTPPLNKIINETLARNGKLSESDLEQIYETYLSHIKTTDRIDKVGARVIGEIDAVMNADHRRARHVRDLRRQARAARARSSRPPPPAIRSRRSSTALAKIDPRDARDQQALENRLALSKSEISELQHSLEAIRAESLTDPLTGLGNRKYFDRIDRHGRCRARWRAASRCRC